MKMTRLGGALALALMLCTPATATDPNIGKQATLPAGAAPGQAIYCPDDNGALQKCAFGGGGGGSGGAITSVDLGIKGDAAWDFSAASPTLLAIARAQALKNKAIADALAAGIPITNSDFFADCQVVTGDQAWTAGTAQKTPCTANGRIRVTNTGLYTLLSNAAASGAVTANVHGGGYRLKVDGTFGGATVSFWSSDATGTLIQRRTMMAPGTLDVNVGQGASVQMQVSGGAPSGLYALMQGIGSAIAETPPATDGAVQLLLAAATRTQLATQITASNGVICKASPNNAADVLIGGSAVTIAEDGTGTGWPIAPGESWASAISSTASLYFISTTAAVVFCHGN